jgi:succinate dehydrogenase / fumarate reductase membrane anchor subunit
MNQQESLYWWSQRLFSFTLIPLTIWIIFLLVSSLSSSSFSTISIISTILKNGHIYLILLTGVIVALHIRFGVEEIVEDYIHDEKIKLICSICLRILAIQMIHDLYLWSMHAYLI